MEQLHGVFRIASILQENPSLYAARIVDNVVLKMGLDIPNWEKEKAFHMYHNLLRSLGKYMFSKDVDAPEELVKWSRENAEREAHEGNDILPIIHRYPPTRDIITDLLIDLGNQDGELTAREVTFLFKRVLAMLDVSINETIEAFERERQEISQKQKQELAQLSAPIVPIYDGIAVLPLIGALDTYRVSYILDHVVPTIPTKGITRLILDFSGVVKIDVEVAHGLFQLENVLRLLGIETVLTGVRTDLSLMAIEAGMNVSTIKSFSTVQKALKHFDRETKELTLS